MGNGWTTFVVSILTATATPVYMEWRQRRRTLLKKALTVCYDNEKSPDGLAVLFGTGKAGYDAKKGTALGLSPNPNKTVCLYSYHKGALPLPIVRP
jgi:hypothetical protein